MDNEKRIGRKLFILSNRLGRNIDNEVSKFGITGVQSRILSFIYSASVTRDVFQKDIEQELDIRRSSVTSVIQLMEKNGLVERVGVFEDGRLKKLVLTEKGLSVNTSVKSILDNMEESLYGILSENEIVVFLEMLNRLTSKIGN